MDYNHGSPRRAPPTNGHATPPLRPGHGNQLSPPGAPEPLRPTNSNGGMTRAEKFEDEKQRIMKSCFSKRDDRGQLQQSYITHIRVEEDAMYPSDPPPPNADAQHKKARVIIVAVKNTGRVYVHKARENPDTTFQIGKTWPLEELQQIESFSPDGERPPEDAQRAQFAGPAGLTITMSKPYYWKAMTPKEKEFFVASLCKIYRKYTSGNLPKLKGFSPREEAEVLGASQPQAAAAAPGGPPPPLNARPADTRGSPQAPLDRPPLRPHRPSDVSVDSSVRSASAASSVQRPPSPLRHRNATPTHMDELRRTQTPPERSNTPRLKGQASGEGNQLRVIASREPQYDRRVQTPGLPPSRLSPQPSMPNMPGRPSISRADQPDMPLASPRFPHSSTNGSPDSFRNAQQKAASPDTMAGAIAASQRLRSPGLGGPASPGFHAQQESMASNYMAGAQSMPSDLGQTNGTRHLPERRRPPLEENGLDQPTGGEDVSKVNDPIPQPLRSKPSQSGIAKPALTNSIPKDPVLPMPGAFSTGSTPSATPPPPLDAVGRNTPKQAAEAIAAANGLPPPAPLGSSTLGSSSRPSTPQNNATSTTAQTASPARIDTSGSPSKDGEARPGLGPMVGEKTTSPFSPSSRSKNWNKAFTAANAAAKLTAFKPRAGGAAGRLFQAQKDSNEPDGITGVVPAPSSSRQGGGSAAQSATASQTHSASNSQTKNMTNGVDGSAADRASATKGAADVAGSANVASALTEAKSKPSHPSTFEESLAVLGIDPSLMDGRGREYEATLADFGWTSNILQTKTVESLEASLRKEVGKLEAGSWLGFSEGKDERIEQFEKMLDRAIAECDEMEGLLTLYGVELSTLNEDVAFIESQSHGIQVQTANQKLLQKELQNLIQSGQS